MSIRFINDNSNYRIQNKAVISKFLGKVIAEENRTPGDLIFILSRDETVRDINRKFLEHDYFTDVISFDYSTGTVLNGEIYISIDTVKRNGALYKTGLKQELLRVMIHGVLHLCGYRDESKRERDIMFERQEKLLMQFEEGRNI